MLYEVLINNIYSYIVDTEEGFGTQYIHSKLTAGFYQNYIYCDALVIRKAKATTRKVFSVSGIIQDQVRKHQF